MAASTDRVGLRFASGRIGVLLLMRVMDRDVRMQRALFHGTAACHNGKLVDEYANFEAAGDFMSGTEVRFSKFKI